MPVRTRQPLDGVTSFTVPDMRERANADGRSGPADTALTQGKEASTNAVRTDVSVRGNIRRSHQGALLAGARPRRSRLSGVNALTPGELRVARLAAEGRTNREVAQALFITTKTVKDHLGSAYGKLQVSSRGELAGALSGGD